MLFQCCGLSLKIYGKAAFFFPIPAYLIKKKQSRNYTLNFF